MVTGGQQPQNDAKSPLKAESGKAVAKGEGRNRNMEPRQERQGREGQNRSSQNHPRGDHAAEPGNELREQHDGHHGRNRQDRQDHQERGRAGGDRIEAQIRTELSPKGEPGVERRADAGRSQHPERGGREKGQRSERGQREADTQMETKTAVHPAQERPEKQSLPERNSKHEGTERPRPLGRSLTEAPRVHKKREESAEDIRIATESVEKDIEFEIKQIQTIRLGM